MRSWTPYAKLVPLGALVFIWLVSLVHIVNLVFERPLLAVKRPSREAIMCGSQAMALVDWTIDPATHSSLPFLDASAAAGAAALQRADPEGFAYLQTHTVPIVTLDGPTFQCAFGRMFSANPIDTNIIMLNSAELSSPELRASEISHELVHVEHRDKNTKYGQHSWLRHLVWMSEEGEAHLQGLTTAKTLRAPYPYSVASDYLAFIYTLPLCYFALVLASLGLFKLVHQPKVPQLQQQPRPALPPVTENARVRPYFLSPAWTRKR